MSNIPKARRELVRIARRLRAYGENEAAGRVMHMIDQYWHRRSALRHIQSDHGQSHEASGNRLSTWPRSQPRLMSIPGASPRFCTAIDSRREFRKRFANPKMRLRARCRSMREELDMGPKETTHFEARVSRVSAPNFQNAIRIDRIPPQSRASEVDKPSTIFDANHPILG